MIAFFVLLIAGLSSASAYTLSGTVYGGSVALPAAVVTVMNAATAVQLAQTTTDAQGRYSVTLASDTYKLTVTPPTGAGFQQSINNQITVAGADVVLDFVLIKPVQFYKISGYVKTDEGYPVRINLSWSGPGAENSNRYAMTNDAGYYEFLNKQEGSGQSVSLYADSGIVQTPFGPSTLIWPINGNQTFNLTQDVVLPDIVVPTVYLKGIVKDSNGVLVVGMQVSEYRGTTTDSNGFYSLAFMQGAGLKTITLTPPSSRPDLGVQPFPVDMSGGDVNKDFISKILSRYKISGHVKTDEGYPVRINLSWSGPGAENSNRYAMTNDAGYYEFLNKQEGSGQSVSLYADSGIVQTPFGPSTLIWPINGSQSFNLTQDVVLPDIVVPTVYVKGIVKDSNGVLVVGMQVSEYRGTTTDSNGFYSLAFMQGASLKTITLTPPSSRPDLGVQTFPVDMSGGDVNKDFISKILSRYKISGYVKTDEGYPVRINLSWSGPGAENSNRYAMTNDAGYYEFLNKQEGSGQSVSLYADSGIVQTPFGPSTLIWPINGSQSFNLTQDVVLPDIVVPTMYLRGHVTDSNGVPIDNVSVSEYRGTTTGSTGFYSLAFMQGAGTKTITFSKDLSGFGVQKILVDMSGGDKNVNVVLSMTDTTPPHHPLRPHLPLDHDQLSGSRMANQRTQPGLGQSRQRNHHGH